jgi:hypothetical protein
MGELAIPLNRKSFLINRTFEINTTAGSVNKGETKAIYWKMVESAAV